MSVNVEQLNIALMSGLIQVKFEKADGTIRVMECTKNFSLIPVIDHPTDHVEDAPEYNDLMKVYDTKLGAWRSFKPSRVINWTVGE